MLLKRLIKARREELGLSQTALANRCDVKRQTVQQWEAGTSEPRRKRFAQLAAALELPISAIDPFAVDSVSPMTQDEADEGIAPIALAALRSVPLVDVGDLHMRIEDIPGTNRVLMDWIVPEGSRAFRVIDESMAPEYAVGEIVVAAPGITPRDGDDVVARVNDVNILRRYRPRGKAYDLVPLADCHATVTINAKNPGAVLMVVIEHRRKRHT